jgi:hypothetical protein
MPVLLMPVYENPVAFMPTYTAYEGSLGLESLSQ